MTLRGPAATAHFLPLKRHLFGEREPNLQILIKCIDQADPGARRGGDGSLRPPDLWAPGVATRASPPRGARGPSQPSRHPARGGSRGILPGWQPARSAPALTAAAPALPRRSGGTGLPAWGKNTPPCSLRTRLHALRTRLPRSWRCLPGLRSSVGPPRQQGAPEPAPLALHGYAPRLLPRRSQTV